MTVFCTICSFYQAKIFEVGESALKSEPGRVGVIHYRIKGPRSKLANTLSGVRRWSVCDVRGDTEAQGSESHVWVRHTEYFPAREWNVLYNNAMLLQPNCQIQRSGTARDPISTGDQRSRRLKTCHWSRRARTVLWFALIIHQICCMVAG